MGRGDWVSCHAAFHRSTITGLIISHPHFNLFFNSTSHIIIMLSSLGKFALAFIIGFTILNTMVQVDLSSVGYPQIPYFTTIVNPQAFTAIIHSTSVTNMPFAFILYAVGLLIFNALINFVAGIPIVFYEMAAISGNPGLIIGALLIGAMLQAMAWLYLLEVLAQFFFPV